MMYCIMIQLPHQGSEENQQGGASERRRRSYLITAFGGASRLVTASAIPGGIGIWAAGYSGTPGSFNLVALRTTG